MFKQGVGKKRIIHLYHCNCLFFLVKFTTSELTAHFLQSATNFAKTTTLCKSLIKVS